MYACVILSTFALVCEYYDQPAWMYQAIDISNAVFVAIFASELLLKLMGFGWRNYLSDSNNVFDGAVALVGVIELSIQNQNQALALVLRVFRVFRVFRLVRLYAGARRIAKTVFNAWLSIFPFSIVFFLFNFLVCLMGMQLFGGTMEIAESQYDCTPSYVNYPHCPPRPNFDTFLWSFVTSFQIITATQWPYAMVLAVQGTNWAAAIFFVATVAIGQLIMMNLLLGVLIDAFLKESEEQAADESRGRKLIPEQDPEAALAALQQFLARKKEELLHSTFESHPSALVNTLCGLLEFEHPFRKAIGKLVMSQAFDWFIMALIVASCCALVIDSPNVSPEVTQDLETANIVFVSLFIVELLLKVVAFGLYGHKGAYLESRWNIFDLCLVIAGVISIILSSVGQLRTARVFWALRPLRLVARFPGMKIIAASLERSSQPVFQVGFLLLLMYIVASVIAVEVWGGQLRACYTDMLDVYGNPVRNYTEGVCKPCAFLFSSLCFAQITQKTTKVGEV